MTTTDDTARLLKRSSLDEVMTAIQISLREKTIDNKTLDVLKEHGWTYDEFLNAACDRIKQMNLND